ncbi:MAG TPA: type II toxin-antitoxin system PemK/MazF family toxin, partial [Salinimicrobium sp.]|nr:type II toxin-antitoxin system PemK/MazF family toxin [Salinimicrobium sp.]
MKQGEIWNIYLDPVSGREQVGRRPAVIISGNLLNTYLEVVIVCPLTTSIKNYKGNLILEPNKMNGLKEKSEVLTFYIRSVS